MADCVLIVEDDHDIVEILSLYLTGAGYEVCSAPDGAQGLDILRSGGVSVVLADLMMPNVNGFDFIKEARSFTTVPIIIISARNQASDKMVGLDLGADGYITKPFEPLEVISYVRAMIRRSTMQTPSQNSSQTSVVRAGDLELDTERLIVRKRGQIVALTASEFKIIARLISSPGRVYTKDQLYEAVSGDTYEGGGESIMVHISNIRSKIEDDPSNPRIIQTVRGLGYRFEK